jgi:hypothetical protein
MRTKDLVIGEYYRHKDNPAVGWARALEVLPPKQKGNTQNYILVRCEWTMHKNDKFGLIKHFRISSLVK